MKKILVASLLCLIIISCTSQQVMTSTAKPELTTEHISGWVVYSQSVNQERVAAQIFLKNLDTGEVTQLTNSEYNNWARWSPDGSQILFVSWTKENSEDIYIMNKDGSKQVPIVATSADEFHPNWSPDGKQILFSSYAQEGTIEIYLFDIVTKDIKQLTNTIMDDYLPAWSIDGKHIAFTFGMVDSKTQIYTMNNAGNDARQITSYDLSEFNNNPVWCPDDTCIVFAGGEHGSKLLLLDLDSQIATPLLGNVFVSDSLQTRPSRSPVRGYITFIVDEMSYAMDMKTKKIYSLGMTNALNISLYP